jgi:hypothetical protein
LVPDVIGRAHADAARALADFKVERIDAASAAPTGEVLAQDPAPATLGRSGSTVKLQLSDGSLTTAASTKPVAAPVTAAAASITTSPATDLAPASTAAPMAPQQPDVPPEARGRLSTALTANAAFIFGAGVLLGLLSGALLMRERLLRRQLAVGEFAPPPTLPQRQPPVDQQPAESNAGGISLPGASSEIRFAARFVPLETTIALAPFAGADEVSVDYSSDHHA